MKNKILVCLLLFSLLLLNVKLQSQCNIICNPTFDGSNPAATGNVAPFQALMVPCWREASISPQINNAASSAPMAASMWALADAKNRWGEGIVTSFNLGLIPGRQYLFSMMARNNSIPGTFQINSVRADFSNMPITSANVPLVDPMPGTQSIINLSNWNSTVYTPYQACIVPSQAWANVYIHPFNVSQVTTAWLSVDDVELFPNFDFAGPNPFKKCDTLPVTIGGNCTSLHIPFTYRWWVLGAVGTIIGTTQQISVNPSTTTQYVCERTPGGLACVGFDTVTVDVQTRPLKPILGPDTSLCPGDTLTFGSFSPYNWFNDYYLNGVFVSGDYIHITKSGRYILRVVSQTSGCDNADTINVNFRTLPHRDTVMYFCASAFPRTICTYPGFKRYKWTSPPADKHDTNQCIVITKFGKYTVKLTDSFGCVTYDTLNVKAKAPPYITLPNDTVLCPGTSIIVDAGPGFLSYLWSTGDTTSSIRITQSGKYVITALTHDSCIAKDSINVTFMLRHPFTLLSQSIFCVTGPCDSIKITPSGLHDTIKVNGVLKKVFCPGIEGCGEHTIYYKFTDSAGCTYDTTFKFTVICPDTPVIDSVGVLCVTDSSVLLVGTPAGGTFSGTGVSGGRFYPGTAGVGAHWVKYCYTDSVHSCPGCDSIQIKVIQITAVIIPLSDTARLCNHSPVRLKATGGNKFYWIHNGSTDSIITVTNDSTYCVIVSDSLSGCPDTACITIRYKANCCDLEYNSPFDNTDGEYQIVLNGAYSHLKDTTLVITGWVRVMPGATWTIDNCKIILKECARITVEGGGSTPAGKMYVYNSNLIGCDWQGIEVWGSFDNCNADTADNTHGGTEIQGKLIMVNDTISDADMAIFVGRRPDAHIGVLPWQQFSGGVIDITHCVFKNNFADIVFSEYDAKSIACSDFPDCKSNFGFSDYLVSNIQYNIFDTLKNTEDCDLFLTTQLSNYGTNPWHCNIINFSDNPIWIKGLIPSIPVCNDLQEYINTLNFSLYDCRRDIRKYFDFNTYLDPCSTSLSIVPSPPCYQNNNGYK